MNQPYLSSLDFLGGRNNNCRYNECAQCLNSQDCGFNEVKILMQSKLRYDDNDNIFSTAPTSAASRTITTIMVDS